MSVNTVGKHGRTATALPGCFDFRAQAPLIIRKLPYPLRLWRRWRFWLSQRPEIEKPRVSGNNRKGKAQKCGGDPEFLHITSGASTWQRTGDEQAEPAIEIVHDDCENDIEDDQDYPFSWLFHSLHRRSLQQKKHNELSKDYADRNSHSECKHVHSHVIYKNHLDYIRADDCHDTDHNAPDGLFAKGRGLRRNKA